MGEVSTIGLDIAKSVFQVHGVDGAGAVVIRKRIGRAKMLEFFAELPACLVGIEACPSAHHWGRELQALGHTVKLMPPKYVKGRARRDRGLGEGDTWPPSPPPLIKREASGHRQPAWRGHLPPQPPQNEAMEH